MQWVQESMAQMRSHNIIFTEAIINHFSNNMQGLKEAKNVCWAHSLYYTSYTLFSYCIIYIIYYNLI